MSDDAHPQTNYFLIFGVLVAALAISVGLGTLDPSPLVVTTIFAIAAMKAFLVLSFFVHLRVEPRWIKVMVFCLLLALVALYIGLAPDVVWVYGRIPK